MKEVINAEYTVVPERTLDTIAAEIRTIDANVYKTALIGAVEIGARLKEAKEIVGHGNWEEWCKINLNYNASWAAKLMKISVEYGDENSAYFAAASNLHICADFSISKALRLLQVPEEQVEEFVESHDVGNMKVTELEDEIKALKTENARLADEKAKIEEELAVAAEAIPVPVSEEEFAKLRSEIDKANAKAEKEKEKADKLKRDQGVEIQKAEEEAARKAEEKIRAELADDLAAAEKKVSDARAAAEAAEKKAQTMNSEETARFKVKVDDLQATFLQIEQMIVRKEASGDAGNWRTAIKAVVENMLARCDA